MRLLAIFSVYLCLSILDQVQGKLTRDNIVCARLCITTECLPKLTAEIIIIILKNSQLGLLDAFTLMSLMQ